MTRQTESTLLDLVRLVAWASVVPRFSEADRGIPQHEALNPADVVGIYVAGALVGGDRFAEALLDQL